MSVDHGANSISFAMGGGLLRLASSRTARTARSARGSVDVLRPLLTKKAQRIACVHFVVLVLFMIGFLYLGWLHEDIEHVYELEHIIQIEMRKEFGKHSHVFDDVNDVDEVWEFIDDSFMKTMIKHKDQVGHFLPHDEWGFLAYYNRVIGGIRFIQERSKEKTCEFKRMDEFYGSCQPYHTHDHHSYGYPACNSSSAHNVSDVHNITVCYEQEYYEGSVDFYHDEGFTMDYDTKKFEMWIDLFDEEEVILKRVQYLKDRHWLDRETKYLTIEFLIYNGQTEPLISKTELVFDFTRVGYVVPHMYIETIPLDPYFASMELKILFEICYGIIIIHMIMREVGEVTDQYNCLSKEKKSLFKAIENNYFRCNDWVGNLLDVLATVCSVWLCIEWVLFVSNMKVVEDDLQSLHRPSGVVAYDDNDADVWSVYHHDIADIEEEIQYAIDNMIKIRTLAVFVVFGIIFEMFRAWEGIPSLQGVSDTIVIGGKGLASFAIVVGCFATIFAGSGMLSFGQQMEEFHDIASAFRTTLLVMTKGDASVYPMQYAIDPVIASIWHWLLICIMNLVCLNVIICILVDSYGEAHTSKLKKGERDRLTMPTLWEQGQDTFMFYSGDLWSCFKQRSKAFIHGDLPAAILTSRSKTTTSYSSKVTPLPSYSSTTPHTVHHHQYEEEKGSKLSKNSNLNQTTKHTSKHRNHKKQQNDTSQNITPIIKLKSPGLTVVDFDGTSSPSSSSFAHENTMSF